MRTYYLRIDHHIEHWTGRNNNNSNSKKSVKKNIILQLKMPKNNITTYAHSFTYILNSSFVDHHKIQFNSICPKFIFDWHMFTSLIVLHDAFAYLPNTNTPIHTYVHAHHNSYRTWCHTQQDNCAIKSKEKKKMLLCLAWLGLA